MNRLNLTNTRYSVMLEPHMQWTYIQYRRRAANHGNYPRVHARLDTDYQYTVHVHDTVPNIDQQVFFPCIRLKGKGGKCMSSHAVGRGNHRGRREGWSWSASCLAGGEGEGDLFVLWWKLGRAGCTGCSGRGCSAATYCQLRLLVIVVLNDSNQSNPANHAGSVL